MASIQIGKTARAAAMPCGPPTAMAMRTGAEWVVNVRSGNCSTGMRFTLSMSPAEAAELGRTLTTLDCVREENARRFYRSVPGYTAAQPEPAPVHYSREMREAAEYEAQVKAAGRQFLPEVERVAADLADLYAGSMKDAYAPDTSCAYTNMLTAAASAYRIAHDHVVLTCGIKRPALQGEWACKCDRCVVLARGDFPIYYDPTTYHPPVFGHPGTCPGCTPASPKWGIAVKSHP